MTTINDANWAFLAEQTGMSAPFNDMYFHYLRSLGYVGTLQDMIAASGFGMNPSGLKNPITNTGGGVPILPGYEYGTRNYPSLVSTFASTGCTVEDLGTDTGATNTVYGLSYGDDAGKPWLFLLGGIHGQHEWPNGYILTKFMSYLSGAETAPAGSAGYFQRIRDTFRVYAIPVANPYGFINNDYENVNNVNLNRNFDAYWADYDDSGDPGTKGSAAFSEVETQIVRDKVLSLQPVAMIDYHVKGGAYYGSQLEIMRGADAAFWTALNNRFVASVGPSESAFLEYEGLPQAQQWARTVVASNGKKPLTATFEPGEQETRTEKSRLVLNLTFQFCLAVADHIAAGWPQAEAQVATIQPSEAQSIDTQIASGTPNGNYGANAAITIGESGGSIRRALLAFPLSDVPPGADVQSAVVTLECSGTADGSSRSIEMHRALVEWFEGPYDAGTTPSAGVDASTWNNRNHNGTVAWGAAGGQSGSDYEATASDAEVVTGLGPYSWDVTDDVQGFVNGSEENHGWFVINAAEATANSRKLFHSASAATASVRPKLVVTYK